MDKKFISLSSTSLKNQGSESIWCWTRASCGRTVEFKRYELKVIAHTQFSMLKKSGGQQPQTFSSVLEGKRAITFKHVKKNQSGVVCLEGGGGGGGLHGPQRGNEDKLFYTTSCSQKIMCLLQVKHRISEFTSQCISTVFCAHNWHSTYALQTRAPAIPSMGFVNALDGVGFSAQRTVGQTTAWHSHCNRELLQR